MTSLKFLGGRPINQSILQSGKGINVKINGPIPSPPPNEPAGRASHAAQGNRGTPASATDQVDLSSMSARLQSASAEIAGTATVDTARVAEIKQAISEGRFQINPDRIADGLLESVRQMLARQQG
jgi:negative regulator of flagellin synthesis FlgM